MRKLLKTAQAFVGAALLTQMMVLAPAAAAATPEEDARATQILANLQLAFPQLEKLTVVVNEITDTAFDGLQEGTFTVNGQQTQTFLISKDNTKFYMISGNPLDVSRGKEEIMAEVAKREEAEAQAAAVRNEELAASIEGLPFRGKADAPVTIIEFSDFQCPYCSRGAATMEEILEKHGDSVKFVFKHFPLGFHKWAKPAAIASHCAGLQNSDAFWTLHDKYFEKQKELTEGNIVAKSKEFLAGSGIEMATWTACAEDTESDAYKAASAAVDADMALGSKHGVSGTPGFFVNGQFLNGAQPASAFEPLIAKAKGES